MTDHITTCVHCHGELSDDQDAYCSEECKRANELPRSEHNGPSYYQREKQLEIESLIERDGEVRIELNGK